MSVWMYFSDGGYDKIVSLEFKFADISECSLVIHNGKGCFVK